MFYLMARSKKLTRDQIPFVRRLEEAPARRGFLDPAEFEQLHAALPIYLREPVRFLYVSGWRVGAMRSLVWARDVELTCDERGAIIGGRVRLQAENSKNKEPWTLPLKGDLLEVIKRVYATRPPECDFVFQNEGAPIGSFRKAWRAACKAAGLEGILVHDLRRSCARNLSRAGVPEAVAMKITGHLTASMFRRYRIVDDSDLEDAMERVSERHHQEAAKGAKVVPIKRVA
jgi:integrase